MGKRLKNDQKYAIFQYAIFLCQKMALRAPKQKNEDHFSTPTSPQNGVEHICFVRLAPLGGF